MASLLDIENNIKNFFNTAASYAPQVAQAVTNPLSYGISQVMKQPQIQQPVQNYVQNRVNYFQQNPPQKIFDPQQFTPQNISNTVNPVVNKINSTFLGYGPNGELPSIPAYLGIGADAQIAESAINPLLEQAMAKTGLAAKQGIDFIKNEAPKINLAMGQAGKIKLGPSQLTTEDYLKSLQGAQQSAKDVINSPLVQKGQSFINDVKRKLVDSAAPIEDVLSSAQKQGQYSVLPENHISNQIDRVARSRELAGQFIKDNGLVDVIKQVPDVHTLDQYLIAKHAPEVGTVTGRNAEADAKLVQELAPVYEPYAQKVIQYGQKLLDYATKTGLVNSTLAQNLKRQYPNYVPLNRVFSELEKNIVTEGKGGSGLASQGFQTVVRRLKGSERAIQNPTESFLVKTLDAFSQGERNVAGQMLGSYKDLPGNPFQLKELKPSESATHTISYLADGVKRTFETTPEIAQAAKLLDKRQLGLIGQIFSYPVRIARVGITGINLPFIASNIAKDQVSAAINSEKALQTSVANPAVFMKSLWNAIGHGAEYENWIRSAGGGTSFDISRSAPNISIDKIRAGRSAVSQIGYTVTHPEELLRTVENVVNRGEEVTRLQQFIGTRNALIKEGRTMGDATILAAKAARENTVNFARSGDWGKALNSVFLYLNAGIQGSRTLVRNLQTRPLQTAAKIGLTVYTPLAAITAWNMSDPQRLAAYNDIRGFEKDNNLIIVPPNPVKDPATGKWNVIKIPFSQEIANLTVPVRKSIEALNGADPPGFADFASALVGSASSLNVNNPLQLAGQFLPQGIKPELEALLNKNTFTGADIVPQYINGKLSKTLPANQQVLDNTSGTARELGGAIGASPIKVEQFVKSAFGGVGSQALNASDQLQANAGMIPQSQVGGQSIMQGLTSRFAQATGGQDLSNLYDSINNANNDGTPVDLKQQAVENGKVYYPTLVTHKDGTTSYTIKSDKTSAFDSSQMPQNPTYTQSSDSPQGLGKVGLYAVAAVNDPQATLNAVITGQPIRKVRGSTVILERENGLSNLDNGNVATQVDHKIALALGGTNDKSNLQILSATDNAAKGHVETYLAGLLAKKQITKEEAQQRDLNWRQEITNLPAPEQAKLVADINQVATATDPTMHYQITDPNTGNRKNIDLTPVSPVQLSGNSIIDKKLISDYKSALTKQTNNVVALYQDHQLSLAQATDMLNKISAQSKAVTKGKVKKPKKISVKFTRIKALKTNIKSFKVKSPKLKLAKTPTYKLKGFKIAKIPTYKIKSYKNTLSA